MIYQAIQLFFWLSILAGSLYLLSKCSAARLHQATTEELDASLERYLVDSKYITDSFETSYLRMVKDFGDSALPREEHWIIQSACSSTGSVSSTESLFIYLGKDGSPKAALIQKSNPTVEELQLLCAELRA